MKFKPLNVISVLVANCAGKSYRKDIEVNGHTNFFFFLVICETHFRMLFLALFRLPNKNEPLYWFCVK